MNLTISLTFFSGEYKRHPSSVLNLVTVQNIFVSRSLILRKDTMSGFGYFTDLQTSTPVLL